MSDQAKAIQRACAVLAKLVKVDAREDFERARAALGHSLCHVGLGVHLAWFFLVSPLWLRLEAGPPDTLKRRIGRSLLAVDVDGWILRVARHIQGCDCDTSDPAVCSGACPFDFWDEWYTWCCCVRCHGPARVGIGDMAVAGDGGDARAGDRSVAIAGYGGSVAAGEGGVIVRSWFDPHTRRRRLAVGYVGEGGIEAGKVYRVNERGEFFEEKPGSDETVGQGSEGGGA